MGQSRALYCRMYQVTEFSHKILAVSRGVGKDPLVRHAIARGTSNRLRSWSQSCGVRPWPKQLFRERPRVLPDSARDVCGSFVVARLVATKLVCGQEPTFQLDDERSTITMPRNPENHRPDDAPRHKQDDDEESGGVGGAQVDQDRRSRTRSMSGGGAGANAAAAPAGIQTRRTFTGIDRRRSLFGDCLGRGTCSHRQYPYRQRRRRRIAVAAEQDGPGR